MGSSIKAGKWRGRGRKGEGEIKRTELPEPPGFSVLHSVSFALLALTTFLRERVWGMERLEVTIKNSGC